MGINLNSFFFFILVIGMLSDLEELEIERNNYRRELKKVDKELREFKLGCYLGIIIMLTITMVGYIYLL